MAQLPDRVRRSVPLVASRRRARARARLVCVGDLMLDIVVRAQGGLESGTDVAGSIRFRAGGSAVNTARAFAALGGSAAFIGAVGDDPLGRRLVAALRAASVTVHAVPVRGPSPRLVAVIAPGGERSFVTDRGIADRLTADAVEPGWLAAAGALHLPAYSLLRAPLADAARATVEHARAGGGLVSVDLASRRPLVEAGVKSVTDLLAGLAPDILFANAGEAAVVAGTRGTRRLVQLAPIVVVKQGAAGCRVMWRGGGQTEVLQIDVATKAVAASDTTGAGDAFDAGFLHALLGAGIGPDSARRAADLRRAALAGHRAAARLLTSPRPELIL